MKTTAIINISQANSMIPLLNYLELVIKHRLAKELKQEAFAIPVLDIENNQSHLVQFIKEHQLSKEDIIILLLTLVPQIEPGFLNGILTEFLPNGGEFQSLEV